MIACRYEAHLQSVGTCAVQPIAPSRRQVQLYRSHVVHARFACVAPRLALGVVQPEGHELLRPVGKGTVAALMRDGPTLQIAEVVMRFQESHGCNRLPFRLPVHGGSWPWQHVGCGRACAG